MAINFNDDVTRTSSDTHRKNVPYPKLGPYKLQYPLGQGGMGQVFKGMDTVLQRSCAVKILPGELSTEKSFRARFRAEAAVLASFDHEHVVRVYGADIEKVADGREEFYLGMELVDGGDLKQFVKKRKDLPKPQEVERIIREILEALKYAHAKGVMHRDLKPENILMKKHEGTVKVSDFGLATVVGDSYRDQLYEKTITQGRHATDIPTGGPGADVIGGTFQYMSPEAKRGEEPSVRDDIYSIGLIAYFLLTGEEASVTAFAERPKEINKRWYRFILGCIKSDPAERFTDANAALSALALVNNRPPRVPITAAVLTFSALAAVGAWQMDAIKQRIIGGNPEKVGEATPTADQPEDPSGDVGLET